MMNCYLCGSQEQDEVQYGQFIRRQNLAVHRNCLYFSSGLECKSIDDKQFYGYLPYEIIRQGMLFKNWTCCYCNNKSANVWCNKKNCQRTFHLICGIKNGTLNQFTPPYRSYCHQHVKVPKYRPKGDEICCICYDDLFGESRRFNPATMLRAPCCRNNWFHKLCLQTFAHASEDFFRCPICNNVNTFLDTMRYWGVAIQDNITQPNEEEMTNDENMRLLFFNRINRPIIHQEGIPNQEIIRMRYQYYQGEGEGYGNYNHYNFNPYYLYDYWRIFYTQTYESKGLRWLKLIADNVLSHPFIILRQQCQVNVVSRRSHLLPFSLIPIIIQLYSRQGAKTFLKGLGFSLIFRAISSMLKNINVSDETTTVGYMIRKCIGTATFCLKRRFMMCTVGSLLATNAFATSHKHKISLKSLFIPYLCMEMVKDAFSSRLKKAFLHKNSNSIPWKQYEKQKTEIRADLISRIITEVAFYPLETVMHRLLLQDTGTIIDNLDNGKTVEPILTYFQGVQDCFGTIVKTEGYTGFYKGFGALITQFSIHTVVINVGMLIFS